jgi:hypothetical protein
MAESVYTNCYLSIAGPGDISTKCKSVTLNRNPDMLDDTCYGDTGKSRKKGLDDWSFDIELLDDFADSAIDDDLWTIFDAGTPVVVIWKPVNTTTSSANPRYYGTGIIESYPLGGAVGTLAAKKFRIIACGTLLARSDSDA